MCDPLGIPSQRSLTDMSEELSNNREPSALDEDFPLCLKPMPADEFAALPDERKAALERLLSRFDQAAEKSMN